MTGLIIAAFAIAVASRQLAMGGDAPPVMTLTNACHLVSNARRVVLGGHTLARRLTRVEGAFWGIYDRSDGGAVFEDMLNAASTAGKAYCLTGLRYTKPSRFRLLASRYVQATNQFDLQTVDFARTLGLADFIRVLDAGVYDTLVTNRSKWLPRQPSEAKE